MNDMTLLEIPVADESLESTIEDTVQYFDSLLSTPSEDDKFTTRGSLVTPGHGRRTVQILTLTRTEQQLVTADTATNYQQYELTASDPDSGTTQSLTIHPGLPNPSASLKITTGSLDGKGRIRSQTPLSPRLLTQFVRPLKERSRWGNKLNSTPTVFCK